MATIQILYSENVSVPYVNGIACYTEVLYRHCIKNLFQNCIEQQITLVQSLRQLFSYAYKLLQNY